MIRNPIVVFGGGIRRRRIGTCFFVCLCCLFEFIYVIHMTCCDCHIIIFDTHACLDHLIVCLYL